MRGISERADARREGEQRPRGSARPRRSGRYNTTRMGSIWEQGVGVLNCGLIYIFDFIAVNPNPAWKLRSLRRVIVPFCHSHLTGRRIHSLTSHVCDSFALTPQSARGQEPVENRPDERLLSFSVPAVSLAQRQWMCIAVWHGLQGAAARVLPPFDSGVGCESWYGSSVYYLYYHIFPF